MGSVGKEPWPPQDESGTAEADWFPIPDMRELAVWRMLRRLSGPIL
jgi:hypothetical protein